MSSTGLKMAATSDHPDETQRSTPKLALFSFPESKDESPSPIYTSLRVSIPFQWEEAPGKPRVLFNVDEESEKKNGECQQLELPPRLNMPSPTTVLDGPYIRRSLSLRKGESWGKKVMSLDYKGTSVLFGSTRWGNGLTKNTEVIGDGFDFLTSAVYGGDGDDGGMTEVKITRMRRRGSFFGLSHGRSNILRSIYEGIKQVVPKSSRRQEKMRKMNSSSVPSL